MTMQNPEWLWLPLILVPIFILLRRRGYLHFSSKKLVKRSYLGHMLRLLPDGLVTAGLIATSIALANPTIPDQPDTTAVLGRDIMVAVDVSLSMEEEFKGTLPEMQLKIPQLDVKLPPSKLRESLTKQAKPGFSRRIDAAQRAILNFVRYRYIANMGDRIGLIGFDAHPRICYPLSHDLRMVYRQLQLMDLVLGSGTNFGGYPPGPLDLSAQLFDELGEAKERVVILVTDGEDELDGPTKKRLSDLLREKRMRLYLVGVGETLAKKDVDIIKVAESSGGRVFRVENSQSMVECFSTIDKLERSVISYEHSPRQQTVFYRYALIAVVLLGAALLAELIIITQ